MKLAGAMLNANKRWELQVWGRLWHSFLKTQACWKLRWFLKQLDKFMVAVKWAFICRSVEVGRIFWVITTTETSQGLYSPLSYLLLATVWLREGSLWSDMPYLFLGCSDHPIILWLCGSLGWMRWAAKSVPGLFFAGSEPDESSTQFSFLHHIGSVGNKTKYYKQFQECQN